MDMDTALSEPTYEHEQADCILIPLDGSLSAERALHAAEGIARVNGATLLLFRTVPPLAWAEHLGPGAISPQMYQQFVNDGERGARNYLEDLASPLRQRGLDVRTRVEYGDAQSHLLAAIEQLRPLLVVLAAASQIVPDGPQMPDGAEHAAEALDDIATKVVSMDGVPVLVVPSTEHHVHVGIPADLQQSKGRDATARG